MVECPTCPKIPMTAFGPGRLSLWDVSRFFVQVVNALTRLHLSFSIRRSLPPDLCRKVSPPKTPKQIRVQAKVICHHTQANVICCCVVAETIMEKQASDHRRRSSSITSRPCGRSRQQGLHRAELDTESLTQGVTASRASKRQAS